MKTSTAIKVLCVTIFLFFVTNGLVTAQMHYDSSSGNVGIGTTNPNYNLHLYDANSPTLTIEDTTNNTKLSMWAANGHTEIGANNDIRISTGDITRIKIRQNGNIGIGTGLPNDLLTVVDGDITLMEDDEEYAAVTLAAGNLAGKIRLFKCGERTISISGNDSDRSYFNAGNLGIGTEEPAYKLEVSGAVMLEDSATPSSAAGHAGIYSNSGELYSIDSAGNTTQISPHDPATGEWVFYSKNIKTGRVVRINMENLVKKVEELTGEKFMEEWTDEVKE